MHGFDLLLNPADERSEARVLDQHDSVLSSSQFLRLVGVPTSQTLPSLPTYALREQFEIARHQRGFEL